MGLKRCTCAFNIYYVIAMDCLRNVKLQNALINHRFASKVYQNWYPLAKLDITDVKSYYLIPPKLIGKEQ
jgi:hypothetical protein